jgi:hypothetical protein
MTDYPYLLLVSHRDREALIVMVMREKEITREAAEQRVDRVVQVYPTLSSR